MGCHAHGPASSEMLKATAAMTRDQLEVFVLTLTDMRPSEVPEWADRSWWRQIAIDWTADKTGER